jgi:hypothetical protein
MVATPLTPKNFPRVLAIGWAGDELERRVRRVDRIAADRGDLAAADHADAGSRGDCDIASNPG